MNEFAETWKNIMFGIVCFMIIISYSDFIRNPEKYGEIIQRYDNARFFGTDLENME